MTSREQSYGCEGIQLVGLWSIMAEARHALLGCASVENNAMRRSDLNRIAGELQGAGAVLLDIHKAEKGRS